jgi:hypothetical protein
MFFHLNGTDDAQPEEYFYNLVDSFDQAARLTADLIKAFMVTRPGTDVRALKLQAQRRSAELERSLMAEQTQTYLSYRC